MNAPAIQFDPESARFGSSRTQKRLEDARLLAGKGLFSDDRRFDNEAAMVLVRSPHAHARLASVELAQALAAPGVIAAWTMPELRKDGVGHIPFPPLFKRADGAPMSAPRRTAPCGSPVVRATPLWRRLRPPVALLFLSSRRLPGEPRSIARGC